MATKTLGTAATTTLVAIPWSQSQSVLLPADLATVNNAILDDQNVSHPAAHLIGTGGVDVTGRLWVPNRGFLNILVGDYVAYDTQTGWPILVSARAAANAGWVHS